MSSTNMVPPGMKARMSRRGEWRRRVFLLAVCGAFLLAGCHSYPEVTSPEALAFLKQLYTACNTRSLERLEACEQELAELVAQQQVSAEEEAAFAGIIEQARAGDWQRAQDAALRFADDQIR